MQRLTAAVKREERPEHPPPRILLFYGKVRLILVELVGEGQSGSDQDDLGRIGGGKVQVRVDSQQDDAREAGLLLSACGNVKYGDRANGDVCAKDGDKVTYRHCAQENGAASRGAVPLPEQVAAYREQHEEAEDTDVGEGTVVDGRHGCTRVDVAQAALSDHPARIDDTWRRPTR